MRPIVGYLALAAVLLAFAALATLAIVWGSSVRCGSAERVDKAYGCSRR